MRLFIAIPVTEDVKNELMKIQNRLGNTKMKLVEKQNMHMTLRFIGEDEPDEWIEKLESIDTGPFELVFDKLGAFPNRDYMRVFWAGCGPVESLLKIHRVVGQGELSLHVTLARIKAKPDGQLLGMLDKEINLPMKVEKVLLMNSTLTPTGPKHEVVHEKTL